VFNATGCDIGLARAELEMTGVGAQQSGVSEGIVTVAVPKSTRRLGLRNLAATR